MSQASSLIRFGVVCEGASLPHWQADSLREVLEMEGFVLAGVLILDRVGPGAPPDGRTRASPAWQRYAERATAGLAALRPCPLGSMSLPCALTRYPATEDDGGKLRLGQEGRRYLADLKLDFLLSLLPSRLESDGVPLARRGEWFWEVGEPAQQASPAPAFWEIYEDRSTTFAGLYEQRGRGGEKALLREGRFKTRDASYAANLRQVLEAAGRWLPQACLDLRNGVLDEQRRPLGSLPEAGRAAPGTAQVLTLSLRVRFNKLRNLFRHFFRHRHWGMAVSSLPIQAFLREGNDGRITFLPRPDRTTFHADPFGWWRGDELVILYEHCANAQGLGSLGSAVVPRAALSPPGSSIEQARCHYGGADLLFPHHVSYPYLFAHEGKQYCIPETAEAGKVSLYESVDGPQGWKHVGDLLSNFAGVDSTVLRYQGRWWLFCTCLDDNPDSHLYLWHAEDLRGPWQPHANNPVKMDISGARPAGTPFVHEGVLYRPTQNGSKNYGGGLRIQKIYLLSPQAFREECCADLDWLPRSLGVDGMHTLSQAGDMTLIDYYRHTFLPGGFLNRVRLFREARRSLLALKQP